MSQELLLTNMTKYSGSGTMTINNNGIILTNTIHIKSDYIELPSATFYEFDTIISCDAGNTVYLQIERFDADKNTITNDAAYIAADGLGTISTPINYKRYKKIVNIKTFSTSSITKYIRFRALNGYNSTTGTLIIHTWSLRAINENIVPQVKKNGQMCSDHFRESYKNASISKNGFIDSNNFYEY